MRKLAAEVWWDLCTGFEEIGSHPVVKAVAALGMLAVVWVLWVWLIGSIAVAIARS